MDAHLAAAALDRDPCDQIPSGKRPVLRFAAGNAKTGATARLAGKTAFFKPDQTADADR